jgi:hypothetical protein
VDQKVITRELERFPPGTIIVHGACRGADNIAGYVAECLGFEVRRYPADWGKFGKGAGPIRNQHMLDKEHPDPKGFYIDEVLAFHEDPSLGTGTKDMIKRAEKASPAILVRTSSR